MSLTPSLLRVANVVPMVLVGVAVVTWDEWDEWDDVPRMTVPFVTVAVKNVEPAFVVMMLALFEDDAELIRDVFDFDDDDSIVAAPELDCDGVGGEGFHCSN